MKNQKLILGAVTLTAMAAVALLLIHSRLSRHLGEPGVKTQPLAGSHNLEIMLPVSLPGFTSQIVTNGEATLQSYLPADTSFRVRGYQSNQSNDDFFAQISVVLMGSDRTSIHRPEICLTGQGWELDSSASKTETIQMDRPQPYGLTVNKYVASKAYKDANGNSQTARGIYVFWFVDDTHLTASQSEWMFWWLPRDLILHSVLERWAYISYFSVCAPGQEDATFERMKKFIQTTVPEFQLMPRGGG